MDNYLIEVVKIIESPYCVDTDDGDKIFVQIKAALDKEKKVTLSFAGVKLLVTSFLNSGIGKLHEIYDADWLTEHIEIQNMDETFLPIWNHVMKGAPRYYKYQKHFDKHLADAMED